MYDFVIFIKRNRVYICDLAEKTDLDFGFDVCFSWWRKMQKQR